MKKFLVGLILVGLTIWGALRLYFGPDYVEWASSLYACGELTLHGFRPIATERDRRFDGKVQEYTAKCRGGGKAASYRNTPWVDWSNYYGTGDSSSLVKGLFNIRNHLNPNQRGVDGALMDLEYQRMELIRFNLFDNMNTYADYVQGRNGVKGPVLKKWKEMMRLPPEDPHYAAVGGGADSQECKGELIRHRNMTGICNDIFNPLMGSTGTLFARNASSDATFPDLRENVEARNRHGDRLRPLKPDPQVISRELFTRRTTKPGFPDVCRDGQGLDNDSTLANCDYKKADFFNVLAAFWIQFMTHDWFSHLEEGHNRPDYMPLGCQVERVGGKEVPLTPERIKELGCRPEDSMERAYLFDSTPPDTFTVKGRKGVYTQRTRKTTKNNITAWWDASQIYGYDENSARRVQRDPKDKARLLMDSSGSYLPVFQKNAPINPAWSGQEATGFPDNWNIGLSFYHNLFAREHNLFVENFRDSVSAKPNVDCGLRNPRWPAAVITYKDVTDEELFQIARLVISAEIAKIHTIEWTTQLLYNEPLNLAMDANWNGFFKDRKSVSKFLGKIAGKMAKSDKVEVATSFYTLIASGAGILGLSNDGDFPNPDSLMSGVNHFGSPFNFPEEFPTVYRLHPLVPDLIEVRDYGAPDKIIAKVSVAKTFRAGSTPIMRRHGLADFGLSMGRQRLGQLALQNHPAFLQNLSMPRLTGSPTKKLDVAALDIIRDRERGLPRFNEFRRQIGLKTLTSFDDFIDQRLAKGSPDRLKQDTLVDLLRKVYGQHICDDSKIITKSQLWPDSKPITDCLGHPNDTLVDNIEDLDQIVGMFAENTRPHGFAISETQFQVFILNASRRLFSDRFFTSSYRPEFYSQVGIDWVNHNGPGGKQFEPKPSNGHTVEVSPLKRILMRAIPELKPELEHVVNAFDPWARDRGGYYSLAWKPRPGAGGDESFKPEALSRVEGNAP